MRIVLMVLCWLAAMPAFAQVPLMTFEAYPPDPKVVHLSGNAWTINASGSIDTDAGKRLERLLNDKRVPGHSMVFLDSPGGDPAGAMRLGRIIRKRNLETYVGQQRRNSSEIKAGKCFSACALAFLGGDYRYLPDGSQYGVHRFSVSKGSTGDLGAAQVAWAAITEYIRSMDVDTKLFSIAAQTHERDIAVLPRAVLEHLNVINNGIKKTEWSIETLGPGMYLKGQRETVDGMGKFMLLCPPSRELTLQLIFDPQGRADEAMKLPAQALLIDGKPFFIERYAIYRSIVNGWINAVYSVDDEMLRLIQDAKTVGFALSRAKEDPLFLGFDGMPMSGALSKLPGFLAVCGKTTNKSTAR